MPIEIRELVIRAIIEDDSAGAAGKAAGKSDKASAGPSVPAQTKLIADCVDHVMDVLREKRER